LTENFQRWKGDNKAR